MINHLVSQRYEVLEKIGDGPLFTVYKARDKAMNRVVALKTVATRYLSDSSFLKGLQVGLTASASLNNPNITHFYERGEDEGVSYLITEFVRGINLKERIRRIAPFTLSVAVDVACAVGEALQYAHALGQTHGDLRPHNIIMTPEGAVKITDFGVMTGVARSSQAQQDVLARSAAYHAPELSMTQPGTVAGDIYAVGAILYEMLTGTPLYAGDSPEAVADMHAFSPIPLPRVINPGVPRSIEGIILKCLQKRPEQRYASAGELLNDLKSVRDALRFGKPLSWSPIDLDKLANDVPAARPAAPAVASAVLAGTAPPAVAGASRPVASAASSPSPTYEPVADVAASSQALPMPATNRLRHNDERVSVVLKIAIGIVTGIIITCIIIIAGIYGSKWIEPETVVVPQLVGKPIEEVRDLAGKRKLHLIEHAEWTDKPRNVVFRTDEASGAKLHEGHDINVWYSKGSAYVDVPNVVGLSKEDAQQKLKEAGLAIGKLTPDYSNTVPQNSVINQNVSYKKRVLHDTAVDLIFSDGPKPDYGTEPGTDTSANADNGTTTPGTPDAPRPNETTEANADPNANPNPPEDPGNNESHEFRRNIRVQQDKLGKRKVRIEFVDANGLSITPVVNELHDEGDKIPVRFTYFGKKITLRVYYNDQLSFQKTFDPTATEHDIVR